jgi:hypothetical protein
MENNNTQQKNIQIETVLEKIHNNEIKIDTKFHAIFRLSMLIFVATIVFSLSVFIGNIVLFTFRISNQASLLFFGEKGMYIFFSLFPWDLILFDLVCIVVFLWLIRSFRFGYKTPVVYLLGSVVFIAALCGVVLDRGIRINERLVVLAERLPSPFAGLYDRSRHISPERGVCRCVITEIRDHELVVEDTRKDGSVVFTIILPDNDSRATTSSLVIGDIVFIAGKKDGDRIQAFGVRKVLPTGFEYVRS